MINAAYEGEAAVVPDPGNGGPTLGMFLAIEAIASAFVLVPSALN